MHHAQVCFLIFMALRNRFPLNYKNNHLVGHTPMDPGETTWSWLTAALNVSVYDADEWIGLEGALTNEFCNFCVRLCVLIGVPLFLISGPMKRNFGPNVAGLDDLSHMSFGNVEFGCRLQWMHGGGRKAPCAPLPFCSPPQPFPSLAVMADTC